MLKRKRLQPGNPFPAQSFFGIGGAAFRDYVILENPCQDRDEQRNVQRLFLFYHFLYIIKNIIKELETIKKC